MKKIITTIRKMSLGIFASVLFTGSVSATTYTATQSGNWSSALTWGGSGSPGSVISSIDNVVIPLGFTVTLDMDVTINSPLAYINVLGGMTATTNSLTITQGSLQGTGTMNMFYVEIGSLGSLTFSGTMATATFANIGSSVTLSGAITISDSLLLDSGSVAISAGSLLTMSTNSNIKVNAGSMSVSGGALAATNTYHVIYVGSSKTTGVEASISTGPTNVWVNMKDSTQTVTMGSNVTVNGTLNNTKGKLAIGAYTLKLMGDYSATVNGKINAISTSRLMLESTSAITSSFILTTASQFQYLGVNVGSSVTAHIAGSFSVDTINLMNGSAGFTNSSMLTMSSNGVYIWANGSFTLGSGSFVGTNTYSVIYQGSTKTAGFEVSGSGLSNVTVNMGSSANAVALNSNLTIAGMLNLNNGSLNLNAHNLHLNGTFSSTANGTFQGNTSSSIKINNTASAFGDTLNFTAGQSMLDSLSINTMASAWVWLGTNLSLTNLSLMSGGVMLTNGNLTINSTGAITGYDSLRYVGTSGSGFLVMNVNLASPYVVFPVGTSADYSPASLQLISGTAGMFQVNVANGMWSNGISGTNMALTQSVVNRTWFIVEPTQTGSLNANLQVTWTASEEMNGFDRTHAYISHYTSSAWDATSLSTASSVGGSFYQMTRANLTSFSPFAVVDQNAVTGIEKTVAVGTTIGLYPNPTSGSATIDLKNADAQSIEIYNEIGSKVYSAEITDKNALHKVDISGFSSGIYYIKVATTTEPIFKKLIKS
jgi:type IX secretion system substrate protein